MSENAENTTLRQLTLFAVDFPVKTSVLQEKEKGLVENAQPCGANSIESFAKFTLDGSLLKTCQGYTQVMMDGSLQKFSGNWPRAGMMRSGTIYSLPNSKRPTTESGASFLLTPITLDSTLSVSLRDNYKRKNDHSYGSLSEQLITEYGLRPTVNFQEMIMGFPDGWTDLEHSETP